MKKRNSNIDFESIILYKDEHYILVNKPPFLSSLADRNDPHCLLELSRKYEPASQLCHRLDKDTSGVLAIARNPEAYRHLSMELEARRPQKVYHALVDGIHQWEGELVDRAILIQNNGTVRIAREGKPAQTSFRTLQTFKYHTLMECLPTTGRMHQIRIHLTTLGAPITGDELYGGKPLYLSALKRSYHLKKNTEEQPLSKRMALHAFLLSFNSLNNQPIKVEAPYPKDMQAMLKQLVSNSH